MAPQLVTVTLARHVIGTGVGTIPLQSPGWTRSVGEKQRLERSLAPLPELDFDVSAKPLRRQPAFIVSISLAIAAAIALCGWWINHQFFSPPDAVQGIALIDAGQNYRLEWQGPDVPYSALLVHDDGEVQGDLRLWIREWALYMPKDYPELAADSCFVVQPLDTAAEGKRLDLNDLDKTGGAAICIAEFLKEGT